MKCNHFYLKWLETGLGIFIVILATMACLYSHELQCRPFYINRNLGNCFESNRFSILSDDIAVYVSLNFGNKHLIPMSNAFTFRTK